MVNLGTKYSNGHLFRRRNHPANNSPRHPLPREPLAIEVLHNLQHQHRWADLKLYTVTSPASEPSTPTGRPRSKSPGRDNDTKFLISGLPPRHMYLHPDLQKYLIRHDIEAEDDLAIQREWVVPLSIGEKWSLKQFCWVFDGLPEREVVVVPAADSGGGSAEVTGGVNGEVKEGRKPFEWKDSKRVLLAMMAHNGMGGDGTITYYVMQEGEVKPRQNG